MQHFSDLKVWQRAHALVLQIYRLTKAWPDEERYGLISQIRRAAVSVGSNIAEGAKRQTSQDYARFLNIAEGSIAETEYQLMVGRDLGYSEKEAIEPLIAEASEISRMLYALRAAVEQRPSR